MGSIAVPPQLPPPPDDWIEKPPRDVHSISEYVQVAFSSVVKLNQVLFSIKVIPSGGLVITILGGAKSIEEKNAKVISATSSNSKSVQFILMVCDPLLKPVKFAW